MKQSLPQARPSQPPAGSADVIVRLVRREEAQQIRALLVKANSYREALELLDMHIKSL